MDNPFRESNARYPTNLTNDFVEAIQKYATTVIMPTLGNGETGQNLVMYKKSEIH